VLPSFDAYYGPFERGGASTGQLLATSPRQRGMPSGKRCDRRSTTPAGPSRSM
jgi:hypothetical protein